MFLNIQISTKLPTKVVNTFLLYVFFFCTKLWSEKKWPVIVQLWLPMWYQNWRVPKSGIDKVPLRLWPPLFINLDLTLFPILSSLLCQCLEECQIRCGNIGYQVLMEGYKNRWSFGQKSLNRISANSFRGNYSFLNLALCTVTFGYTT